MKSILAYLNGNDITNLDEIKSEIETELAKGAEKAAANRALYDSAKEVVLAGLSETPATVSEIYEQIKEELPDGFSRSKVQYGLLNYWIDDITIVDGNPKTYARKA